MIGAYIRDRLSDPSALFHLLNQMTNTQVDAMVRFHCKIVCPLIHRFAEWALRNLGLDVRGEWTRTTDWDALSSTETMRMVRAMYRFQLMCNLFGLGRYIGDRSRSYFVSGHNTIFQAFLSNFTAFELEEVRCIFGYVVSRYDKVFQSIAADLHPDNPRFNTQQRPPTPDGAFDFLARGTDSTYDRSEYQLGTASRGLDLLHAVLIKTPYNTNDHGQHEDLVVTIQPQIARGPFLDMMDGALDTERYHYYRSDNPTERDEKEKKREPMIFVGDVSTWHDQDGDKDPPPPLAWTLMWGGTYSNLYGSCIPESIARWGYIFWDAERLIRSGGKELLMRQWEEEWSDFDVREQFPL
ncbi:hypothetical protein B0T21DRAFT_379173 [Apiosordaria backusii]|uniref:Uncharacterized protein n=1 Tax=Apiosordaria backusii TaxID=314023 RepID=A0AA39ZPR5_9PEZI|nr:hypothetical protein B0T21DRAFT_379173 [Apiosordaria backusii]